MTHTPTPFAITALRTAAKVPVDDAAITHLSTGMIRQAVTCIDSLVEALEDVVPLAYEALSYMGETESEKHIDKVDGAASILSAARPPAEEKTDD